MNDHLVSMLNSKRKLAEQSIIFHRCCTHYGNAVRQISSSRKNWHNELLKTYVITITKKAQYDSDIHWSVLLLAHSTEYPSEEEQITMSAVTNEAFEKVETVLS